MKNKIFIKSILSLTLVSAMLICSACSSNNSNNSDATTTTTEAPTNPPTTAPPTNEDIALDIVNSMSLDEKIGQVLVAGFSGLEAGEELETLIKEDHVGSVILFGDNTDNATQLTQLTNDINTLSQGSKIPTLISMDEEGGNVSRMPDEVEVMPEAYTIAQKNDLDLTYRSGLQIANQLSSFGVDTGFSPDLDIWSNPENTVISTRAYGTTADEVVSNTTQIIKAYEESNIIAVGKHFPGHGDTITDSHYGLPVIDKSLEELEESELLPFKSAIENGIPSIMVGHLLITQLDDDYPASLSSTIVTGLLRQNMGFNGVVATDDLTMEALTDTYTMDQIAVLALNAGCDMLLVCHEYDNVTLAKEGIETALDDGTLSMQRLEEAVYRIVKMKLDYELDNSTIEVPDVDELNEVTEQFYY